MKSMYLYNTRNACRNGQPEDVSGQRSSDGHTQNSIRLRIRHFPTPPAFSNFSPFTIQASTSRYAVSKSLFTITISCTPSSLLNSISLSACSSRFCRLSSVSVPLPRNRCSRTGIEGGERNRKRACRSVFLTCLTPCDSHHPLISVVNFVKRGPCGNR